MGRWVTGSLGNSRIAEIGRIGLIGPIAVPRRRTSFELLLTRSPTTQLPNDPYFLYSASLPARSLVTSAWTRMWSFWYSAFSTRPYS